MHARVAEIHSARNELERKEQRPFKAIPRQAERDGSGHSFKGMRERRGIGIGRDERSTIGGIGIGLITATPISVCF